jgi:hypothetical protein
MALRRRHLYPCASADSRLFVVVYDVGSRKNNIQKDGPFLESVFRLNLP